MQIKRLDGRLKRATRVRHLSTLTGRSSYSASQDLELYRLEDGTEIVCVSPSHDCRVTPREIECDLEALHL